MKYHEFDSQGKLIATTAPDKWEWIDYPSENLVSEMSGLKVGWRTYSTKQSAEECAYAAAINGVLKEREGYDFGYHEPSTITEKDGNWVVVIP